MTIINSNSELETKHLAMSLAKETKTPHIFCLYGELGAGKTVFTKGFASALGIEERKLKSPTYNLMKEYHFGQKKLYHFDFYRIQEPDEILIHDLETVIKHKNAYVIIEWPERVADYLPQNRTNIEFKYESDNARKITINNDRTATT